MWISPPAKRGQRCYYCNNIGHFSHLCKSRHTNSHRYNTRRPSHRRHSRRSSSRSSSRSTTCHRCTRRHRSPTPHPIDTLTITGPNAAPSNNTENNSTQLKKCKSRQPTPLPSKPFSFPTFSDTEDTSDTASEVSIEIHSQDEDESSTNYNTISPPRHYYIPITPPRTMLLRPSTMFPRPSCIPIPKPCKTTKIQHNKNKPTAQKVRPSHIPVFNHKQQEPITQVTQPKVQQITNSLSRPHKENTRKQPTQVHPHPTPVRKSPQKSPLLPTPPAQSRPTYIPRPSAFNNNRKPTFSGPSPINNHRFHQQPYIPRPHTPRFNNQQPPLLPIPSCQHKNFITRPYQQPQGHCTQQVSPQPYVPIAILTPYNQLNNVLAHQTNLFNPNKY